LSAGSYGCHQSVDDRAALVFIGDLNAHHSDWLGYSRTNDHGVAASDFATSSGCSQLIRDIFALSMYHLLEVFHVLF
jgi:hypothetical protein